MAEQRYQAQHLKVKWFVIWTVLAAGLLTADYFFSARLPRLESGWTVLGLATVLAIIMAVGEVVALVTGWWLVRKQKPPVEGVMIRRIYLLAALLTAVLALVYGLGRLEAFTTFFGAFGGMLLGWSLQQPVSGFAAWLLVSLGRPFRPGDRVQFPSLNLTGDVQDIGPMYTVLDQVGGTIGSEEAVGRFVLVPNAMLFSQVVINYTVVQEAPYMLDEVVVRITYDSDWQKAEKILLDAATEVTKDIITATKEHPYIRSDMWDYGILMRLRYQTHVQDRSEIAYKITKQIFETFQRTPSVDLAIPFIYSYRAGMDRKEADATPVRPADGTLIIQEIPVEQLVCAEEGLDPKAIESVARSIASQGLLQPIVVVQKPGGATFEVVAGHMRCAACRKLGWKKVPAMVKAPSVPLK